MQSEGDQNVIDDALMARIVAHLAKGGEAGSLLLPTHPRVKTCKLNVQDLVRESELDMAASRRQLHQYRTIINLIEKSYDSQQQSVRGGKKLLHHITHCGDPSLNGKCEDCGVYSDDLFESLRHLTVRYPSLRRENFKTAELALQTLSELRPSSPIVLVPGAGPQPSSAGAAVSTEDSRQPSQALQLINGRWPPKQTSDDAEDSEMNNPPLVDSNGRERRVEVSPITAQGADQSPKPSVSSKPTSSTDVSAESTTEVGSGSGSGGSRGGVVGGVGSGSGGSRGGVVGGVGSGQPSKLGADKSSHKNPSKNPAPPTSGTDQPAKKKPAKEAGNRKAHGDAGSPSVPSGTGASVMTTRSKALAQSSGSDNPSATHGSVEQTSGGSGNGAVQVKRKRQSATSAQPSSETGETGVARKTARVESSKPSADLSEEEAGPAPRKAGADGADGADSAVARTAAVKEAHASDAAANAHPARATDHPKG